MRYGVLVDLALKVLGQKPVDISMGHANKMALMAMRDASYPPTVINIAGPMIFEDVCRQFGHLFGATVSLIGTPAPTVLLNNAQLAYRKYGKPIVPLEQMVHWTADWLRRGGVVLDKPTHFEVRDGQF